MDGLSGSFLRMTTLKIRNVGIAEHTECARESRSRAAAACDYIAELTLYSYT
jgi:hypothetical protein